MVPVKYNLHHICTVEWINHITPWKGNGTLRCVRHNAHTHKMILRTKSGCISGLPARTIYIGVRKATRDIFVYRAKNFGWYKVERILTNWLITNFANANLIHKINYSGWIRWEIFEQDSRSLTQWLGRRLLLIILLLAVVIWVSVSSVMTCHMAMQSHSLLAC